jgi:hypothetical protein
MNVSFTVRYVSCETPVSSVTECRLCSWSTEYSSVPGCAEHGNETWGSVKRRLAERVTSPEEGFCSLSLSIYPVIWSIRSRGSSGSIVSDYRLDDRAIEVRSPAGTNDFSSILCVQTGSEAHPASCTVGTGGPIPGAKRGRGVTLTTHPHLVPRSSMSRSYTSSPPSASVTCRGTTKKFDELGLFTFRAMRICLLVRGSCSESMCRGTACSTGGTNREMKRHQQLAARANTQPLLGGEVIHHSLYVWSWRLSGPEAALPMLVHLFRIQRSPGLTLVSVRLASLGDRYQWNRPVGRGSMTGTRSQLRQRRHALNPNPYGWISSAWLPNVQVCVRLHEHCIGHFTLPDV